MFAGTLCFMSKTSSAVIEPHGAAAVPFFSPQCVLHSDVIVLPQVRLWRRAKRTLRKQQGTMSMPHRRFRSSMIFLLLFRSVCITAMEGAAGAVAVVSLTVLACLADTVNGQ